MSEEIDDQDPDASESVGEDGEKIEETSMRRHGGQDGPKALWLISYADFMTVLMIFFLAMYGYSYLGKEQVMKAAKLSGYQDFMNVV
jgi:flagellar motor protein MotB